MPIVYDDRAHTFQYQETDGDGILAASHPSYVPAAIGFLNSFNPIFRRAKQTSEFAFLLALLGIRGMSDAGWDPFESTVSALESIREIFPTVSDKPVADHLALWVYGHVMEASEQYEILANVLSAAAGGTFNIDRFRELRRGRLEPSPGKKIDRLSELASAHGFPRAFDELKATWNRDFRNAIFHSDYSLYGGQVRIRNPLRAYSHDQAYTLINRAIAFHESLVTLRDFYIGSYAEPTVIPLHPSFKGAPGERAIVIVREGHGAVGMKSAWTQAERAAGQISFRLGRFRRDEIKLLEADPELALLPAVRRTAP